MQTNIDNFIEELTDIRDRRGDAVTVDHGSITYSAQDGTVYIGDSTDEALTEQLSVVEADRLDAWRFLRDHQEGIGALGTEVKQRLTEIMDAAILSGALIK